MTSLRSFAGVIERDIGPLTSTAATSGGIAIKRKRIVGVEREAVGRRKDGTEFSIDLAVGETILDGQAKIGTIAFPIDV